MLSRILFRNIKITQALETKTTEKYNNRQSELTLEKEHMLGTQVDRVEISQSVIILDFYVRRIYPLKLVKSLNSHE